MKTAYTYTVLRYVHDTVTGEFVNVGVALLAPGERYAGAKCRTTYGRLSKVFPGMDGEAFKNLMRYIQSQFEEMGARWHEELPFEPMPGSAMELARRVLPVDDSSLQWSPPGSGLTEKPSDALEQLFSRLVMAYEERSELVYRSDDDVWRGYKRNLEAHGVLKDLQSVTVSVQDDHVEFQHAWKNGRWNCLEPVSFDLTQAEHILDKAHRWLGLMTSVQEELESFKVYLLVGEPKDERLRSAFDNAVSILRKSPGEKQIVRESEAADFSSAFAREIKEYARVSQDQES